MDEEEEDTLWPSLTLIMMSPFRSLASTPTHRNTSRASNQAMGYSRTNTPAAAGRGGGRGSPSHNNKNKNRSSPARHQAGGSMTQAITRHRGGGADLAPVMQALNLGGLSSSSVMSAMEAHTTLQRTRIISVPGAVRETKQHFSLVFAMDVSHSMEGSKLTDTKNCVREMVTHLPAGVRVGLIAFGSTVETVLLLTPKYKLPKVNGEPCIGPIIDPIGLDGCTALWDAILEGFEVLFKRDQVDSHPYLIVVTDGMDNSSRRVSRERLQSILMKPGDNGYKGPGGAHFHINLMTVGNDADREGMKAMCVEGKGHMHHYHAPDAADVTKTFSQVKIKVFQAMKIEVTEEVRTSVRAACGSVRHTAAAGNGRRR